MFEKSRQRPTSADHDELVSAFLSVRRAVGLLGLALPVLLYFEAHIVAGGKMQPSISEFYHTAMGDVLVGTLVAIGIFLIAYVGHKPNEGDRLTDWWVSTIAGVSAVGVALFPVLPTGTNCNMYKPPIVVQGFVFHWCQGWGGIHFVFAGVFFVCMALFCFRLFPKNAEGKIHYFDEAGNVTYFFCGVLIVVANTGLALFFFIRSTSLGHSLEAGNFVFWFETLGVLAFATAWLTKGNLIGGAANFIAHKATNLEARRGGA